MSPAPSAKICVICGQNCAGSPRVKDHHGRYYCKPCYEDAMSRRKSSGNPAPAAPAPPSTPSEPDLPALDKPLLGDDIFDIESSAKPCPKCGSELEAGAILCVNCGYNVKEGKVITPTIVEGDSAEASASSTKWPIVIGIVSIVFAVFGALQYGMSILSVLLTPQADFGGVLGWAAGLFVSFIMLALAVGLGISAVALIQRKPMAAKWLRWWAWAKMSASLILTATIVALVAIALGGESDVPIPPELAALGIGIFIVVLLPFLLWLLFWPAFILLWLRRPAIREEVAQWSASKEDVQQP